MLESVDNMMILIEDGSNTNKILKDDLRTWIQSASITNVLCSWSFDHVCSYISVNAHDLENTPIEQLQSPIFFWKLIIALSEANELSLHVRLASEFLRGQWG